LKLFISIDLLCSPKKAGAFTSKTNYMGVWGMALVVHRTHTCKLSSSNLISQKPIKKRNLVQVGLVLEERTLIEKCHHKIKMKVIQICNFAA
jgi:hypothetical protein